MRQSPGARQVHRFSQALEQKLQMYALAASAAGAGIVALAPPAEARIVYTPANQRIVGYVPLDLNNDGTADFTFNLNQYSARTSFGVLYASTLRVFNSSGVGNLGNSIWRSGYSASALPTRVLIGNNRQKFASQASMAKLVQFCNSTIQNTSCSKGDQRGQWGQVTNRYLGLKFLINGRVHYGWARLTVDEARRISATLTGYAYETVADRPILIGNGDLQSEGTGVNAAGNSLGARTRSLGSLALGAYGRAFEKAAAPVGSR